LGRGRRAAFAVKGWHCGLLRFAGNLVPAAAEDEHDEGAEDRRAAAAKRPARSLSS
jgi:hypothetical protein